MDLGEDAEMDTRPSSFSDTLNETECQEAPECAVRSWWSGKRVAVALLLMAIFAFIVGQATMATGLVDVFSRTPQYLEEGATTDASEISARLDEVATLLDSSGIYEVDADAATEGTIEALLESTGDAYAQYFDEDEYADYLASTTGSFIGIGIAIYQDGDDVVVSTVYEGTPAEDAGVQVGDVVVSIDEAEGPWDTQAVQEAIERDPGETVDIVWSRDGETLQTTIEVQDISIPSVEYQLVDTTGIIKLSTFNSTTTQEVTEALEDLQSQGATSIVLDLRDNGGGFLEQAIGVVSLFVEEGIAVQLYSNSGEQDQMVSGEAICDLPMAVLVNSNSASASEIVAAALQDHGRATIVGETTYGKGTVQTLIGLSFGGGIKFTIAEYRSPDGDVIDGVGVTPDIVVESSDSSDDTQSGNIDSDAQLQAAIEAIASQG